MRTAAMITFCLSLSALLSVGMHHYAYLSWKIAVPVAVALAMLVLLIIEPSPKKGIRDTVMFRIHRGKGKAD